jgi:CheY-like chemotaxis protein
MHFTSASRVLDIVKAKDMDLLITEGGFKDAYSGRDFVEDLRDKEGGQQIPILMLQKPNAEPIDPQLARDLKVQVLQKPIEPTEIVEVVTSLVKEGPSGAAPVKKKVLKTGEVLFNEGEKGDKIFILIKGALSAYKKSEGRDSIKVGDISDGQLVGEMAFFENTERSASVQADESSMLYELEATKLHECLEGQPAWFRILTSTLLGRIKMLNSELAEARKKLGDYTRLDN